MSTSIFVLLVNFNINYDILGSKEGSEAVFLFLNKRQLTFCLRENRILLFISTLLLFQLGGGDWDGGKSREESESESFPSV